ncbi:MAG: transcriptional regulator, PadR-like family [Rubritepida sp.]|nr:transcriptional regulator, PadR-like family [Rubritepida sp.]
MFGHRTSGHDGEHGRMGRCGGHHAMQRGRPGGHGGREWGMDGAGRGPDGGGRRRMFDQGGLRLVLLRLIADTPRHGYDLIRAIEERTGGAYAPSPGVVYPTLTLLDEMGLIAEQQTEGARKLFAITAEGTAHLEANAAEAAALLAKLDALGAARDRTDSVPLRRAMHNLRSVLQNRMEAGLDQDRVHDAVALIDEAARKIERL